MIQVNHERMPRPALSPADEAQEAAELQAAINALTPEQLEAGKAQAKIILDAIAQGHVPEQPKL